MKIMIVGNGGREHAIILQCLKSKHQPEIHCSPGIDALADNITNTGIGATDIEKLVDYAKSRSIDVTIVGPEAPLVAGIVDKFEEHKLSIFGPSKAAAELENSKAFSKDFMRKYKIPTASYEVFEDFESAKEYLLKKNEYPIVIKASGLAGGKGVMIPESEEEAISNLDEIMNDKIFGKSGDQVVIEGFLKGEEASIFAFCDGIDFKMISPSQDHKRIGEGDTGKNTGGMGAYAPAPIADSSVLKKTAENIIRPLLDGMRMEGRTYKGVLFCGLMIDEGEPSVVEFNVRLGDPETQVVLPLIKSDFLELIISCITGNVTYHELELHENAQAMNVVLASGGYPETYEKGKVISGVDKVEEAYIIHAGTKIENGILKTNGGRVMNVTCVSDSLQKCADTIYREINKISFDGMVYRKDIGHRVLNKNHES